MTKEKAQEYLVENFGISYDKEDIIHAMIGFAKEMEKEYKETYKYTRKDLIRAIELARETTRGEFLHSDNTIIQKISNQTKQEEQ